MSSVNMSKRGKEAKLVSSSVASWISTIAVSSKIIAHFEENKKNKNAI